MIRLIDLLSDIANSMGYYYTSSASTDIDSDTTNLPRLKRWKRLINDAYLSICHMMPKEFLIKEKIIRIPAAYSTGTVALTQGDASITGTGTAFTRNMQLRQIVVSGDYRPYFLKTYVSGTSFEMVQAYLHATEAAAAYNIATWALPLPHDYLAPVDKDSVMDVDRNNKIEMVSAARFRASYPITYMTGVPYWCCIEGYSPCSLVTDVCNVIKDNLTITFVNYTPLEEDVGRLIRLAGESIPYIILTKSGASTVTVTPVVQQATANGIVIDIDPSPVPLLWFNSAPASELRILLRYHAKPKVLWTDEQRCELVGDYELAFKRLAAYNVISAYSGDRLLKTEALAAVTAALAVLPKHIDTTPILKEVNRDASSRWPGVTFPNVGIAT